MDPCQSSVPRYLNPIGFRQELSMKERSTATIEWRVTGQSRHLYVRPMTQRRLAAERGVSIASGYLRSTLKTRQVPVTNLDEPMFKQPLRVPAMLPV